MAREKFTATDMIEAIRSAKGMVYVAARQLNCSPNTIYNYASRYPTVQEAIDNERGLLVDTAELALWKALQAGEGWAISLVLKTLGKARGYIERQEHSGPDGGAVRAEVKLDLSGMDAEQLRTLAQALED